MGHLRQHRAQTVVVKARGSGTDVGQDRIESQEGSLCVWCYWHGIIYYELLPYGQTLNSALYCQQLDRLKAALIQKRPSLINRGQIVFHQDNARPHTSLVTRQKLQNFLLDQF